MIFNYEISSIERLFQRKKLLLNLTELLTTNTEVQLPGVNSWVHISQLKKQTRIIKIGRLLFQNGPQTEDSQMRFYRSRSSSQWTDDPRHSELSDDLRFYTRCWIKTAAQLLFNCLSA